MKSLYKYSKECVNELRAIGIYPNYIDRWEVNSRAKSRWGQCKIERKYGYEEYVIQIAEALLADDAPVQGLKETIMHELLHAVDDCMNHGEKWKMLAERVNKAYGYNIKRTNSYADKGFTSDPLRKTPTYKYKIECTSCKRVWHYERNTQIVKSCRVNKAKCPCGVSSFLVTNL